MSRHTAHVREDLSSSISFSISTSSEGRMHQQEGRTQQQGGAGKGNEALRLDDNTQHTKEKNEKDEEEEKVKIKMI